MPSPEVDIAEKGVPDREFGIAVCKRGEDACSFFRCLFILLYIKQVFFFFFTESGL